MRRARLGKLSLFTASIFHITYETLPLTHKQMQQKYGHATTEMRDQKRLLELTEQQLAKWKLNKWEFRIPSFLNAQQKENVMLQLDIIKSLCINHNHLMDAVRKDMALVSSLTGTPLNSIQGKTRSWLQEEAAKLRWRGEVNNAKDLRDAFLRLETYASPDYHLLERLCCIYGLGMIGTFSDAFSNLIVEDPQTKTLYVEEANPFTELLHYIVTRFPHFYVIYDFLGFNPTNGYRTSLAHFLVYLLEEKNTGDEAIKLGRVLFHNLSQREILFDFGDSKMFIGSDDSVFGLPDFLYINKADFFLITIASNNHWLRNRQVPHRMQLEGIARRGSLVLGIPMEKVRIRNLLLPPNYLDRASLLLIVESVLAIPIESQKKLLPWLSLYEKELSADDLDYCELSKTINEEEWLTL